MEWKLVIPIRLVAADAGFFPPGAFTLFADMVNHQGEGKRTG